MLKKMGITMFFIIVFLASLDHFSYVLSEPDIRVHLFKDGAKNHIRILLPTSMEHLYAQIIDENGAEKAYIVRDYYSKIKVNNTAYHQYLLSNQKLDFSLRDQLVLFPKTKDMRMYTIASLPTTDRVKSRAQTYKTTPLKVMTYNIHHGRDRLGFSTMEDLEAIIRAEAPDIVGLQEVDQNMMRSDRENQVKILAENLGMYYSFGPNKNYFRGRYGNGILSKYPILEAENIGLDGDEPRGLLHATIKIEDQHLHTMVTHLGLDANKRQTALKALEDYVNMYKEDLILMGDFNARPWALEIQNIKESFIDTGAYWGKSYAPTYHHFTKKARIDYIFIGKNHRSIAYKVIPNNASDHYPVVADVMLGDK